MDGLNGVGREVLLTGVFTVTDRNLALFLQ